jgi:hypothetical protein
VYSALYQPITFFLAVYSAFYPVLRSRSRIAMLLRLRLRLWYILNMVRNWKISQNVTVYNPISSFFQQYTINLTESCEQDKVVSTCIYSLVSFRNFAFLYSRVGAGAARIASKFLPGAGSGATLLLSANFFLAVYSAFYQPITFF